MHSESHLVSLGDSRRLGFIFKVFTVILCPWWTAKANL